MDKDALLAKAIHIAVNAHAGQVDKAGKPYIFHPLRVMNRCRTIDEKIVAILHDVIEDTDITPETLFLADFPNYLVEAVQCLTRREDESYSEFVERVATNPLAVQVKIADLLDNMDVSRLETITDEDTQRLNKYADALKRLRG